MDRRQRKTREAIFHAFTQLLSRKDYSRITVGEIIEKADVGRATFYAHFETKDFLLRELCEELFCHLFDAQNGEENDHRHIFDCDDSGSVFLHLIRHIQRNDNNILLLLSSRNNELFLSYFRRNIEVLVDRQINLFEKKKGEGIPDLFWKNHIATTYVETIRWWIACGMKETPEEITEYFFEVI